MNTKKHDRIQGKENDVGERRMKNKMEERIATFISMLVMKEFLDLLVAQFTDAPHLPKSYELLLFIDECKAVSESLTKLSNDFDIELYNIVKDQIDEVMFKMAKITERVY
jgi:hypothetical protein